MNAEAVAALNHLKTMLAAVCPPSPPGNARAPSPVQILFESWVSRDHWHLFNEGLPLLLGVDPQNWPERVAALSLTAGTEIAKAALVEVALKSSDLPILNPTQPQTDWRVSPMDLYLWTVVAGFRVPEPYATLVQFVLQVVKRPELTKSSPGAGTSGGAAREKVLGAALALLARSPESCRDEHGLLDPMHMAARIAEQSIRWFEAPTPPMPISDMATLIAQWTD